ncbi:MAG: hypothetical protein OXO50_18065 [Caldilineaceae bacterium]|nr:hypothetical protein [Caldilineaceae bacterium]
MTMRPITSGPKHHWFGYYDKLQFDPASRYVLGMEVDFEHRSPNADDLIGIGMIDLADGNRWIELGETRAWCWQQGCMLQWIPGSDREVVWNDRVDDGFVCRIVDVHSGKMRTVDCPIYTISPDGRTAIGADFRRINHMRPGYGYAGIPDPNFDRLAPDDVGIHRVDLKTGHASLIVSIAQVAAIPYPHMDISRARHYFNHLLFNTDGSRFIFLHRWRFGDAGFSTRMMTAASDGSDIYPVDQYGHTSHFIWRDPEHILAWARHPSHGDAFYIYRDNTQDVEVIGKGVMKLNGHCTYLADTNWILNDTYPVPRGEDRVQELYLYNVESGERTELSEYASYPEYTGEWRCDLHPRSSPDGRLITVDSVHGGDGRQIYLMDISAHQGI